MSETPVFPILGQTSERTAHAPETNDYAAEAKESLASWHEGFERADHFNLEREEAINTDLWSQRDEETRAVAPEYASPKTRADEVAESLGALTDDQLRAQLDAHTGAIVHGLRKQYGLIA